MPNPLLSLNPVVDPKSTSLVWKEVLFNLQGMEGSGVGLILKCYDRAGGNTLADGLNWRDITLDYAK